MTASPLQERSQGQGPSKATMFQNAITPCPESISFTICLDLTEVSVNSHMKVKVILTRETGGGAILQQSPSPAAIVHSNASPTSSLMIKREVLTAALHKFGTKTIQIQWTTKTIQWCSHQQWSSKSMEIWRNKKKNH